VKHEVQYRTPRKITEIPGITVENYGSATGYVLLSPLNQTIDNLKTIFLNEFGVQPKSSHHFAPVYCFGPITPGMRMWDLLASTDLQQLIENPEVRFVFSYISCDQTLLEP
jgi:hypothetical protein